MMKLAVGLGALLLTSSAVWADDMVAVQARSVHWNAAPPVLPKGAEIAVLMGDPGKSGLFIIRLKLPAGYRIPPHHHPTTENVTVISGTFHVGMGDKLDRHHAEALKAGGFASLPADMNHYAWASDATVVEVAAEGPFAITYVNAADNPAMSQ